MGMVRELLMHGHKDPFSEGYHFSGGPIPGLRLSVLLSILVVGWGGYWAQSYQDNPITPGVAKSPTIERRTWFMREQTTGSWRVPSPGHLPTTCLIPIDNNLRGLPSHTPQGPDPTREQNWFEGVGSGLGRASARVHFFGQEVRVGEGRIITGLTACTFYICPESF